MADMGTYQAFGRPFNPVLDSHFLADGMNLLQGTIGRISAFIVTVLLIALVIGIVLLTYVILGQVPALLRLTPKACSTALLAGLIIWKVLSFAAGKEHPCHFIT